MTAGQRGDNETELQFILAWDIVRWCPTFAKLAPGEQRQIEAVLFEVYPPTE